MQDFLAGLDLAEPQATITKTGRFSYWVRIEHGLTGTGDWWCVGMRHARSKARRELVKYQKVSPSWTVRL